jgi:hypothetical protein
MPHLQADERRLWAVGVALFVHNLASRRQWTQGKEA